MNNNEAFVMLNRISKPIARTMYITLTGYRYGEDGKAYFEGMLGDDIKMRVWFKLPGVKAKEGCSR